MSPKAVKSNYAQRFKQWITQEKEETVILLRSIPATVVSLFVVSVICMNLLANKTLVQTYWIALDGGILISWLSFMCMDIITKYFGPKASNKIAIMASVNPAKACGCTDRGEFKPGYRADVVVFDQNFDIKAVFLGGERIA